MRSPYNDFEKWSRGSAQAVLWLLGMFSCGAFSVSSSVRAETDRVDASSNGCLVSTNARWNAAGWWMLRGEHHVPDAFCASRFGLHEHGFPSGKCGGQR